MKKKNVPDWQIPEASASRASFVVIATEVVVDVSGGGRTLRTVVMEKRKRLKNIPSWA